MTAAVAARGEEDREGPAYGPGTARPPFFRPGWPLTVMLVGYPLWWALGLGTLIVFIMAVPMAVHLWRTKPLLTPPGFGLWLLFLVWVAASTIMLGVNPPGTLPQAATDRVVSVVFTLAGYIVAGVVLLYLGNLREEDYPQERLRRQLAGLFVVTVAGGLLGTYFSHFQFTSPVESLLPRQVAANSFVQSFVHPAAAQVQQVLGYPSGRPAAPFGYTNTWGYVLSLLLGFFAISWLGRGGWRRYLGIVVLALSAIPVVHSLNRGLWIGLGAAGLFCLFWLVRVRRFGAVLAVVVGLALALGLLVASPLNGVVQERLAHQKSNGIRSFTIEKTLEVVSHSPVLGLGSNRRALGSSNSIAVGRTSKCVNCGNPTLGSNGQLWQVLIGQGAVGAGLYLLFFLRVMWAFRRDKSALAGASVLAIVLPFLYMFLYNAIEIPLVITFLAIGLLWRNDQTRQRQLLEEEISATERRRRAFLVLGQGKAL